MATVNTIDMSRQMLIGKDDCVESSPLAAQQARYTVPGFHNRNSTLFPSTQQKLFSHTDIKLSMKGDNSVDLSCVGRPPVSSNSQNMKSARIQSAYSRLEKNVRKNIDASYSVSSKSRRVRPNSSGTYRLRAPRPPSAATEKDHKTSKAADDRNRLKSNQDSIHKSTFLTHELNRNESSGSNRSGQENCQLESTVHSNSTSSCFQQRNKKTENSETCDVSNSIKSSANNYDMSLVPVGGQPVPVVDIGYEAPIPSYDYQMPINVKHTSHLDTTKPFMPPSAADIMADIYQMNGTQVDKNSEQKKEDVNLKPSVYGFNKNRHVYGSNPDVSDSEEGHCTFPYKLSTQNDLVNGLKALTFPENQAEDRSLPENLEPLRPWLTEDVSEALIGVNPNTCLVFLPSLLDKDLSDIPEVPAPHTIEEDLPFKEKVPLPEVFVPKKYDHPAFNRKPVEEWVCKHSKPHTRIYSEDGQLLHERFQGQRTIGIIRKEIAELENLLKGIGTHQSDCSVVKYQAEIDHYRSLHLDTMALVPERLLHPPAPEDTFGLKKFYQEHDEVVQQISRQHALCLQELAVLEAEVGILSDRKYFKHQVANKPD